MDQLTLDEKRQKLGETIRELGAAITAGAGDTDASGKLEEALQELHRLEEVQDALKRLEKLKEEFWALRCILSPDEYEVEDDLEEDGAATAKAERESTFRAEVERLLFLPPADVMEYLSRTIAVSSLEKEDKTKIWKFIEHFWRVRRELGCSQTLRLERFKRGIDALLARIVLGNVRFTEELMDWLFERRLTDYGDGFGEDVW